MKPQRTLTAGRIPPLKSFPASIIASILLGSLCSFSRPVFSQNHPSNTGQVHQQTLSAIDLNQKAEQLEAALRQKPDDIGQRVELGRTLLVLHQYPLAISHLDTAIGYDYRNAEAWFYKGLAHEMLAENNAALRAFARTEGLQGDVTKYCLELGELQLGIKSSNEALRTFDRALSAAMETESPHAQAAAWYWKGRAHEAKDDTANAAKSYRRAVLLQRNFADAGARLSRFENQRLAQALVDSAKALRQRLRLDEALSLLENALRLDANRARDIQALIKQIKSEQKAFQGRTTPLEPFLTVQPSAPPAQRDTNAASTQDTIAMIPLAHEKNDSATISDHSVRHRLPDTMTRAVGILAILVILVVVFFWIRVHPKGRAKLPSSPEPLKHVSLPDVIKTIYARKMQRTPTSPNVAPPVIPRYRIERELGRGGFGCVYKAYDTTLLREVALKTITLPGAIRPSEIEERIKRFVLEAVSGARLDHPNIAAVYNLDEVQSVRFITMKYVQGVSLRDLLEEKKRLSVPEALPIVRQTCAALGHAHQFGVIHRDIKPENIMLRLTGEVSVVDFGIAKLRDTNFTLSGLSPGDPLYASPEQWRGDKDIDGRSDIYSLGIVFYEMLAGQRPKVESGRILLQFDSVCPGLLKELQRVIAKMLTNSVQERSTAEDVIAALAAL